MLTPAEIAALPAYTVRQRRQSVCPECDGTRYQIERRRTALYARGFVTVAVRCSACGGTGRVVEIDQKSAAAGDI